MNYVSFLFAWHRLALAPLSFVRGAKSNGQRVLPTENRMNDMIPMKLASINWVVNHGPSNLSLSNVCVSKLRVSRERRGRTGRRRSGRRAPGVV
jgi:hypothetical protein